MSFFIPAYPKLLYETHASNSPDFENKGKNANVGQETRQTKNTPVFLFCEVCPMLRRRSNLSTEHENYSCTMANIKRTSFSFTKTLQDRKAGFAPKNSVERKTTSKIMHAWESSVWTLPWDVFPVKAGTGIGDLEGLDSLNSHIIFMCKSQAGFSNACQSLRASLFSLPFILFLTPTVYQDRPYSLHKVKCSNFP